MAFSLQRVSRQVAALVSGARKVDPFGDAEDTLLPKYFRSRRDPSVVRRKILPLARLARIEEDAPRTVPALAGYIHHHFHELHRSDLEVLFQLAECAAATLGPVPHVLPAAQELLLEIQVPLHAHLHLTEHILFPMLGSGADRATRPVIEQAVAGNLVQLDLLEQFQTLTNNFTAPKAADRNWCAFCFGAREFSESMAARIHLENEILFPSILST